MLQSVTTTSGELADEQGLTAAFSAHGGELFGYARRSLGDAGLAEEAVQETFARAWRARDRFDPSLGGIRAWLFAIERRIIIDLARKRAVRSVDRLPYEPPPEGSELDEAMRGWLVEEALRRLRPEHRTVVVEIYYRGRPSGEVASLLGIPEGTVRSRLFYALKALRLALDEVGWEP
ncbi:MAG TPA: sigma-70 family RNA polymerase sigma factor [Acidimicrobiales bacterium]